MLRTICVAVALFFSGMAHAEENVDLDVINQIRNEGFNNSHVVEILRHLTDDIGPRLTGSPQLREANEWTLSKFQEWGLKNGALDPFEFGRGWNMKKSHVDMISPRQDQLYAFPLAWTVGTDGPLQAETILAVIGDRQSFEANKDKYKGKLAGKIVLVSAPRFWKEPKNDIFKRYEEKDFAEGRKFPIPTEEESEGFNFYDYISFYKDIADFLAEEGAVAAVKIGSRDAHMLQAQAYFYMTGETLPLPWVEMASEHYNRIARLLDEGQTVELRLDLETVFFDNDPNAYNTIAEIPGQGRNPEIVMAGGHLDSWVLGDGAVDDGAGVAVVMEAMRILSTLPNFHPKRTIRAALWGGEEQGYVGSLSYIRKHFAERPYPEEIKYYGLGKANQTFDQWPITKKSEYDRLSAYFNLDNGSGRIRGILTEGNVAAVPIFEAWLAPFADLDATEVITNFTGGTDHVPMQNIGLPAYQFIQDPLDYSTRLHHTQLDTLDHIVPEDLKQAAVIMASFLYLAATRDDPMPRKPFPQQSDKDKEKKAREAEEKAKAAEEEAAEESGD